MDDNKQVKALDPDVAVYMLKSKLLSDVNSSGLPITVITMCVKELLEAVMIKQDEKIRMFTSVRGDEVDNNNNE